MPISWLQLHFPAQTVMAGPSFRVVLASNQDSIWSPHTPSCVEGQQHHYHVATCRWDSLCLSPAPLVPVVLGSSTPSYAVAQILSRNSLRMWFSPVVYIWTND